MTTSLSPAAATRICPSHDGPHPAAPPLARLLAPATDRAAWEARLDCLTPGQREELDQGIAVAKAYEIRPLLASHYRTYMDTGDRTSFEKVLGPRRSNLSYLAIGAGMLGDASCLGPLEDLLWATCEETTWVTPGVSRGLPSHEPATFIMELTPAMTGVLLASVDQLLEDQLDAKVRRRIAQALLERVVRPFLDKDYWWINPGPGYRLNNWTAVCCAGALACVTLIPELASLRQQVVDHSLDPLKRYLETFDEQGGCEEGGGYWVYGMDYLTLAAELLRLDPAGPDLYAHERLKAIARFPARIFMGNRQWITFSDCRQQPRLNPGTLGKLDQRLGVPTAGRLARQCEASLSFIAKECTLLHSLAWWPQPTLAAPAMAEAHVYFPGIQWMVSRADPTDENTLLLSAHAGHNGYSHNHNDVGHLSVYYRTQPLLVDLGVPVYDRDYFSPRRMDYLVASSLGHSVPCVNGQAQLRGQAYASRVLGMTHTPQRDELRMDLTEAYGREARLSALTRTIALERSPHPGRVEVMDAFTFASDDDSQWRFESVTVTTGKVTLLRPGVVRIEQGDAVGLLSFAAPQMQCHLDVRPDVLLPDGPVTCTRICLSSAVPSKQGKIRWTLTPLKTASFQPPL